MTTAAVVLASVNLFGALNGFSLGLVLALRRPTAAARFLGATLICASLALSVITLEHAHWLPRHWSVYALEEWLSLLSGPLLLHYVFLSLHRRHSPLWTYLPPLAHLLGILALGERLRHWIRMEDLIWLQMTYTAAALVFYFRWRRENREQPRRLRNARLVAFILFSLVVLHLAQIIRRLFSEITWLRDLIPVIGTLAFYAFVIYALAQSRVLFQAAPDEPGEVADERIRQLERLMAEEKPWLDPELGLGELAGQLDMSANALSQLINQGLGLSFYEYLARYRLAEARRVLSDPEEFRFTVEGIARQCGFRSRSSFYKAFKDATGLSPAAYRDRRLGSS